MGRPKRARLPPPNLQASKGGRLKIQLPTAHGTLGGPAARSVRPRPRRGVGTRGQEERAPGAAVTAEGARQLHEAGRGSILGRGDGMGRGPGGTLSQNGQEASVAERMGGPELRAEAPRREAKGWGGGARASPLVPHRALTPLTRTGAVPHARPFSVPPTGGRQLISVPRDCTHRRCR